MFKVTNKDKRKEGRRWFGRPRIYLGRGGRKEAKKQLGNESNIWSSARLTKKKEETKKKTWAALRRRRPQIQDDKERKIHGHSSSACGTACSFEKRRQEGADLKEGRITSMSAKQTLSIP